ncbi:MAG: hypothetical protein SWX82_34930 [Cyanobacteriota bacterium]|nr:hypothetical protein [Cyanobacteriota bacterium]
MPIRLGVENCALNQEQKQQVKEWMKSQPKSIKKVKLKINKE